MSTREVTLGIDVGGTKIAYGLVDPASPREVIAWDQLPSRGGDGSAAQQVTHNLEEALRRARILASDNAATIARIGVGSPGVVDPTSGIIVDASPTIPGWAGTDLGALVREVAPGIPFAIHNDVRTWAYGEHHLVFGNKLADERVLYVALGTGVGGAIIDQGQLLRSPRLCAGEIAELMACDFRGIADRAENIASGESLARYYNELHLNPELSGPIGWRERREGDVDLAEVLRRSEAGDELASEIIAGNLRGFGAALAGLAHAADIGAIVFGGGVTGIGPVVTRALRAGLEEWLHATKTRVDCYFTSLPHPAPILAAALYAVHHAE